METTSGTHLPRALEDPSGRRLRRLRWVGRGVALLFLLWFVVILIGALGVGPAGRVLFGDAARLAGDPPPVHRAPPPRQPSRSDLVPALPPIAGAAATSRPAAHGSAASAPGHTARTSTAPGHSAAAPGHTSTTPTTRGKSASAPGHTAKTSTTPGRSAAAPGHKARTGTTHGRSASAPGHTSTTSTTHGKSASAPGHARKSQP